MHININKFQLEHLKTVATNTPVFDCLMTLLVMTTTTSLG